MKILTKETILCHRCLASKLKKQEIDELESRKKGLEGEVQWLEDTIGRLRYITEIYIKNERYNGLVSKKKIGDRGKK